MLLLPFQITCSELLLMKPHTGRTDLQSKNEKSRQRKKKKRVEASEATEQQEVMHKLDKNITAPAP